MKVKELMSREVVTVGPATPLKEVARLLAEHGISGLPVCDEHGRVVGVISEGDILYKERGFVQRRGGLLAPLLQAARRGELEKARARTAGEAMSAPALTIGPERPAAAAARLMVERHVNRLPVVADDGSLLGIVTRADLVRAFIRPDEEIAAEIREDILRRVLWVEPDSFQVGVHGGEVELAGELETEADVSMLQRLVEMVPGVVAVRSAVTHRPDEPARPPGSFVTHR